MLAALAVFFPVRFGCIPLEGATAFVSVFIVVIGAGVIAGLMIFGCAGRSAGMVVCVVLSLADGERFDFSHISAKTGNFDTVTSDTYRKENQWFRYF